MKGVPARRAAVGANVSRRRPMAALTRHAELSGLRIDLLRKERLGAPRRAQRRLALRRVAGDTDGVPAAAFRNQRKVRWMHDRRSARNPPIVSDQANRRQLAEQPSVTSGVPVDLLMMRS